MKEHTVYTIVEVRNGRTFVWTTGVPETPLLTIEEAGATARLWREMMPDRKFYVRSKPPAMWETGNVQ